MSTYKGIFGKTIKHLSSDPDNSTYEGQIWYNTTEGKFKTVVATAAWSSGANMIVAGQLGDGLGVQDAALRVGGETPSATNKTEEYNGSGWSAGANYPLTPNAVEVGLFGVQTAGVGMGGYISPAVSRPNTTNEYDGSTWTAGGTYPIGASNIRGAGTLTAGLGFGGDRYPTSPRNSNATNEYDGSTWTAGGNLGTAGYAGMGGGTQTAGIYNGGSSRTTSTEEYNGSSWSSGGAPPIAQSFGGSSGQGPQTNFSTFGINGTPSGYHQSYDGSTWTAQPALATPRYAVGGAGSSANSTVAFGGRAPAFSSATEEFNFTANTITAGAWASGPSLGTGRYQCNGQNVGSKTAGLIAGGQGGSPATTFSAVEEWDGASWTAGTALPNTRAMFGSVGTQTAAFIFGGYGKPGAGPNPAPGSPNDSSALNYDGSTWTAETSMPSALAYITGAGTQTAALAIGGFPALTTCSEYDGSSWTSGGSMTTGRENSSAFGIQTAAVAAGGGPGSTVAEDAESYDGSSWSSESDLSTPKTQAGTAGTQTNGLVFLGSTSNPTNTIGWNGTSWFTQPSTASARYGGASGSAGVGDAYYAGGGGSPPTRTNVEEFVPETTAINIESVDNS